MYKKTLEEQFKLMGLGPEIIEKLYDKRFIKLGSPAKVITIEKYGNQVKISFHRKDFNKEIPAVLVYRDGKILEVAWGKIEYLGVGTNRFKILLRHRGGDLPATIIYSEHNLREEIYYIKGNIARTGDAPDRITYKDLKIIEEVKNGLIKKYTYNEFLRSIEENENIWDISFIYSFLVDLGFKEFIIYE
jgi:hypothetical protein